jgi:hypothetical protein
MPFIREGFSTHIIRHNRQESVARGVVDYSAVNQLPCRFENNLCR